MKLSRKDIDAKGGLSVQLFTAEEVAKQFKVSTRHIYALAKSGELRYIRIGEKKALRFPLDAVEEFLRARMSRTNQGD